MKGIKVTNENLSTVFGHIQKYLAGKDVLVDISQIENISTYKQAKKALDTPTDSYKVWNNIEFNFHQKKKVGIDIGNQFELEHSQHITIWPFRFRPKEVTVQTSRLTDGDTIWITQQGVFIKTWRGIDEKTIFYVIS
jgi:hypothetical protein